MKKITTEVSAKKEEYGTIVATVHDKYGNLKQRVEQPVDSFNRQFWRLLQRNLAGLIGGDIISLTNVNGVIAGIMQRICTDATLNDFSSIIVGSGTNPTTYDKVLMDSMIDIGNGVGQLVGMPSTCEFSVSEGFSRITRSFISLNSESSTLTINEVGLSVTEQGTTTVPKSDCALYVRDVLNQTLSVSYEETLTVQYVLRISSGTNNYFNVTIRPFGLNKQDSSVGLTRSGLTNTTGNYVAISTGFTALNVKSEEGMIRRGFKFGTSNAAFSKTQIDLVSPINHGSNSGELFYHSTTNSAIQENSTTNSMRFLFYRAVENRSGSNIVISEAGLFTDGATTSSFMLDRKIIDPPVTITNGNAVTFTWEFCYEV
jgi:hypothetical protein